MNLARLMRWMLSLTILSLVYINMQMQIFDLAYQGKNKERTIRRLNDENRNAICRILALKSSYNLGDKVLAENTKMQFMDKTDVVFLGTRRQKQAVTRKPSVIAKSAHQKRKPVLLSLSGKVEGTSTALGQ